MPRNLFPDPKRLYCCSNEDPPVTMKNLTVIAAFVIFCFYGVEDANCRAKRAILDDFEWLPAFEAAMLVDNPPISSKVQRNPQSFFNLDDGDRSETLEIELDNAENRRHHRKNKAKRETTSFPSLPVASAVLEERSGCHETEIANDEPALPMRVVAKKLSPSLLIPRKRSVA